MPEWNLTGSRMFSHAAKFIAAYHMVLQPLCPRNWLAADGGGHSAVHRKQPGKQHGQRCMSMPWIEAGNCFGARGQAGQ